jgi:uncharacterized ferritin-like protein (DUF455 family)
MSWSNEDARLYAYLHHGVEDHTQIPSLQDTSANGVTALDETSSRVSWLYPSRPAKPELVPVVPSHKVLKHPSNAHIMHALAHVELNAVDMYMDTVIRFACAPPASAGLPSPFAAQHRYPALPEEFASDMLSITQDEARYAHSLSPSP